MESEIERWKVESVRFYKYIVTFRSETEFVTADGQYAKFGRIPS